MTIVYNHLFDMVRKERSSQELQELPITFYSDAKTFFDELAQQVKADPFSPKGDAARLQLSNGRKLLKQLYEHREQKILQLSQTRCRTGSNLVDTSKLLPTERQLFEQIVSVLCEARKLNHLLDDEVREATPVHAPPPVVVETPVVAEGPTRIRFIKPMPQFVGKNMEPYGPFEEESVADVPSAVAQLLIRKGVAKQEE
jgi:DNA replication initiation complex subunit (GINS family)